MSEIHFTLEQVELHENLLTTDSREFGLKYFYGIKHSSFMKKKYQKT